MIKKRFFQHDMEIYIEMVSDSRMLCPPAPPIDHLRCSNEGTGCRDGC